MIEFEARGLPLPQGSARAFVVKGRAIITSDTRRNLKAWRHTVTVMAQEHAPPAPWEGPVSVRLIFRLPKPKSAPKTRRTWPAVRPDLDKYIRAVLDSLSQVIYSDDSQVVKLHAEKDYGVPGVRVRVEQVKERSDG